MVDDDAADRRRLGQPEIDGDAAAALRVDLELAPIGDASAFYTKMKAEVSRSAGIGPCRARDADPLVFVVVGPERSIPSASRATAGRSRVRNAVEAPADSAAK